MLRARPLGRARGVRKEGRQAVTTNPRPKRADARRNYERLLTEARTAFIEQGTDTPLEEIARRADVGIGTLYRHFPDRTALIEAAFQSKVDAIVEAAGEQLKATSPTEGLTTWLRSLITASMQFRGVGAALVGSEATLAACKTPLREAGRALLERAQQAGEVRQDADIPDLLRLTHAIGLAAEAVPEDPELADRLLALTVDGLRARD
jgi:AcrR family transcriptional regulator